MSLLSRILVGLAIGGVLVATGCAMVRPTVAPVPTPTQPPGLAVDCWVDPPEPALGTSVTVNMNLLNHGTPINGVLTTTRWEQGGALQTCITQVQYDLGSCQIQVTDMEPGVYVPVTVSVEYIGWTFLGYTGFTPR